MDKRIKLFKRAQIILVIILPINLAVTAWMYADHNDTGAIQIRKVLRVIGLIRRHYVDSSEDTIGYANLVDGALDGMLRNLDKHSHYLKPEELTQATERMNGEYAGIGITFTKQEDKFLVVEVIPNGPAEQGGLLADDEIYFVDGTEIHGMEMGEVRNLVKGKTNTPVTLGIYRPATKEDLDIKIIRRMVQMPTVRNIYFPAEGVLYLQISQFNRKTSTELSEALSKHAASTRGLIIDLRYNPGGLLVAAREVSSIFLEPFDEEGSLRTVVTTIPRNEADKIVHHVETNGLKFLTTPIVILVNEQSASASEIVAGCLKDYNRATLIGVKTYGKGSVQEEITLSEDNSAVRLTIAKYYTPSKNVIHGVGIKPDVESKVPRTSQAQLFQQLTRLNPKLQKSDVDDPQLTSALKVIHQKMNEQKTNEIDR